jgi:integrase/recombinase XerD
MKINRFGKAEVLTPDQINLLFTEGFVKPRDKALLGLRQKLSKKWLQS